MLTEYSGKSPDGKWAAKSTRNTDRYEEFLKGLKINTYLDVGSGDGRDAKIIAEKVKAKRVILADVSDYRVDDKDEFYKLEINQPIQIENIDLITGFHFLHHSSDMV